jgi:hypothetical protein
LAREETSESPVRKGTVYHPFDRGGTPLGDFQVVEFMEPTGFTFHKLGTGFFTRYPLTATARGGTHLEYHAWADDDDLSAASRFTPDTLAKLKAKLETELPNPNS